MTDNSILIFVALFFIGYYIGSQKVQTCPQCNHLYNSKMNITEGHCGFCPDDCEPRTSRCKH